MNKDTLLTAIITLVLGAIIGFAFGMQFGINSEKEYEYKIQGQGWEIYKDK